MVTEEIITHLKGSATGNVYGYRNGDTKTHAFSFFIIK